MTNTEIKQTARGQGAYYARIGVRCDLAVQYSVTLTPELAGHEAEIRKAWADERFGRR